MDSLSDFGCFAYYFNTLMTNTGIQPKYFAHYPLVNTALVLLAVGLFLLASKLLLRTIDLHFSEVVGEAGREQLLETAPEKRSCVLNLPALLQRCLPHTWWGDTLYVVFMLCIVTGLVHRLLKNGLSLYGYLWYGDEVGWGGLFVLFAVGLLVGPSLSLQTMEGVQIGCVLLSAVYLLSLRMAYSLTSQAPVNLWEVFAGLYDPCMLSTHLLIPSVLAASRAPSQRHMVIIAWAVALVIAINLPLHLFIGLYGRSETIANVANKIVKLTLIPTLFSMTHTYMVTLVDIIIAWRYGLNLVVARRTYPLRIKAVQILLPLLTCLPITIIAYFNYNMALYIVSLPFGFDLAWGTMYLIIPFCYRWTVQQMGEEVVGRMPAWWTYSLYAAWVFAFTRTIVYYYLYRTPTDVLLSSCLSGGIFVVMAIWQTISYFLR